LPCCLLVWCAPEGPGHAATRQHGPGELAGLRRPGPRVPVGVAAYFTYQTAQAARDSGEWPVCAHLRQSRMRHWHRPARMPAGCDNAHAKSPRIVRFAGPCTEGRPWRLVWLVYAPKGPPSASSPACPGCAGYLDAKTAKHVHFPYSVNRVKLACRFAKKASPRDPPARPRAPVGPKCIS
jgi:hypothetical protein